MGPFLSSLAFVVGGLLAAQAAANVQLSAALRSRTGAAGLQLGLAAAALGGLAAALGTLPALGLIAEVEPWHLAGGIGSAIYILAGIVLFPRLGALVSVGLFITGQMAASLALDGFGLLGLHREPVSAGTAAGAAAVIAGMTMIVRTAGNPAGPPPVRTAVRGAAADAGAAAPEQVALIAFGLAAGAALPVQAAMNAQLRSDLDAPFTAAAVSFVVATAVMSAVAGLAVAGRRDRLPRLEGVRRMPWWGWLGAVVGASYVTVTLLAVPVVGAAPAIALTVAGQQFASAAVDHLGLLRMPRRPVTRNRWLGVFVLVIGAGLIQLA